MRPTHVVEGDGGMLSQKRTNMARNNSKQIGNLLRDASSIPSLPSVDANAASQAQRETRRHASKRNEEAGVGQFIANAGVEPSLRKDRGKKLMPHAAPSRGIAPLALDDAGAGTARAGNERKVPARLPRLDEIPPGRTRDGLKDGSATQVALIG